MSSQPRHIKTLASFFTLSLLSLILQGCLTVEYKEYRFRMTSDHSGEAAIRFVNILSESDDTLDVSKEDFDQLIAFYLKGNQVEEDNPGYRNVRKRLFEEHGQLVGELQFTFDSLATIRLFKYDVKSPFMYFVGSPISSEQLVETDGIFGGDWMPVVFWAGEKKELYVKTRVLSEVSFHKSLLQYFKTWQAGQPKPKSQ